MRGGAGWVLALVPFSSSIYLLWRVEEVSNGGTVTVKYPWVPTLNTDLSFYLDGLSLLFGLLITLIGTLVVIYAGTYLADHPRLGRFYLYLLAFMASMLGLVFSDGLLTLFVFWELTSLTSFLLIGFEREKATARAAAVQSLLVTGAGGLALLAGLLLLGQTTQTWELSALLTQGETVRSHSLYPFILLLVLIGAFTKSAQFPFHFWLPAAMEAPTPVSAYLHSSTMVKAGVYLLARTSPILGGTESWLYVVSSAGILTMVVGAYLALQQTHFKRLLAYSTISALGTLTLLLGLGSSVAIRGAMVFLLAHALYKAALFLVAGVVIHETGESDITRLGGLKSILPLTSTAAFLAALSMAGFPPLAGYLAKEMLFESTWMSAWLPSLLTLLAVAASAMIVAVAGLVGARPFLSSPVQAGRAHHEAPPALWLGPLVLAVLGLLCGLLAAPTGWWFVMPAVAAVLKQPVGEEGLALWHGLTPALWFDIIAVVVGIGVYCVWSRLRGIHQRLSPFWKWGPSYGYQRGIELLNGTAALQTRFLQSGHLRSYVLIIVSTTLLLAGGQLLTSKTWPLDTQSGWDVRFYEICLVLLILGAAVVAATSNSRFTAIIALGVVGYAVALIYTLFGAPDLAMTQFVVETLTVILFVLVFYHLPPFARFSTRPARLRDGMVALAAGGLMTTLVLVATGTELAPTISNYFAEHSLSLAHGRNIVNVILVDFRGLDTMGEITVVGLAALGVYALIKGR